MPPLYLPIRRYMIDFDHEVLLPETDQLCALEMRRISKSSMTISEMAHVSRDSETLSHLFNMQDITSEVIFGTKYADNNNQDTIAIFSAFLKMLTLRTGFFFPNPACSEYSITNMLEAPAGIVRFFTVDRPTIAQNIELGTISLSDALWAAEHIEPLIILSRKKQFGNAISLFFGFTTQFDSPLFLVVCWACLEALFAIDAEHTFRLALLISYFLETGSQRRILFDDMKKSYRVRSRFVHGAPVPHAEAMKVAAETFAVLRRAIIKCLDTGNLPNERDLLLPDDPLPREA